MGGDISGWNNYDSPQRAVALVNIQAVLHGYAGTAREGVDFNVLASRFFHPDAVFRLPNGTVVEASQMSQVIQGDDPKFIRHHITTVNVSLVSPTEAHATSQYFAVTDLSSCDHWGEWRDVITRTSPDGQWLIADKTVTVDGCDAKGWAAPKYGKK